MKRFLPVAILLTVLCLLLGSCATTSEEAPKQFSLSRNEEKKNEIGMLVGSVSYGVGFFFPTAYDILDISLIKTDSVTGLVSEISHQRIRNLLNSCFTCWRSKLGHDFG